MKARNNYIRFILLILSFTDAGMAFAQKLSNIQSKSIYTAANSNIDIKEGGSDSLYQAFNDSTKIFYTISNDDKLLYLSFQAKDPDIISKILLGGATFTVDGSDSKDDKNATAITYPIYDGLKRPLFSILQDNAEIKEKEIIPFMNSMNSLLATNVKRIGVEGIKEIRDSTISVFNKTGINAVSFFNRNIHYSCKLTIPLKYLKLGKKKPIKFSYNIRLNGEAIKNGKVKVTDDGRFIIDYDVNGKVAMAEPVLPITKVTSFPTDFWGEYTLAKH